MKEVGIINRHYIEKTLSQRKDYYECKDCNYLFSDVHFNVRLFSLKSIIGTSFYDSLKENYKIEMGLCLKCNNDKLEVEK